MPHTDPISDLITRLMNALRAKHRNFSVPASKMKTQFVEVLAKEGFIKGFRPMKDLGKSFLDVELRYRPDGGGFIRGIKKLSKPGLRLYSGYKDIPKVRSGYGVIILSTPKGILTDKICKQEKLGGELLCSIW